MWCDIVPLTIFVLFSKRQLLAQQNFQPIIPPNFQLLNLQEIQLLIQQVKTSFQVNYNF